MLPPITIALSLSKGVEQNEVTARVSATCFERLSTAVLWFDRASQALTPPKYP